MAVSSRREKSLFLIGNCMFWMLAELTTYSVEIRFVGCQSKSTVIEERGEIDGKGEGLAIKRLKGILWHEKWLCRRQWGQKKPYQ